jgi:hypothetical protein
MNAAISHPDVSHSGSHIAAAPLRDWIGSAGQRLKIWIEAYASAVDQAALCEELRGLSDAELVRRGIPRSERYRCVFE